MALPPVDEETIGRLMSIHLGVDGFECDLLSIVRRNDSGLVSILPARHRPRFETAAWLGVEILEKLAEECLAMTREKTFSKFWRTLWATPWPIWAVQVLSGHVRADTMELPAERIGVDRASIIAVPSAWERLAGSLDKLSLAIGSPKADTCRSSVRCMTGSREDESLVAWANKARGRLGDRLLEGDDKLIGCVVTGTLCRVSVENSTLAMALIKRILGGAPAYTLIDDVSPDRPSLLAEGAALCAARLASNRIPYLDTLPRLKVLTMKMGEPNWSDLLKTDDQFVEGGKPFQPPDRSGYFIRSGENEIRLDVAHAEHDSVRTVHNILPRRAETEKPIRLRVSMEPARGNARVQVLPEDPTFLGDRRIYLDWKSSTDTGKTMDELTQGLPRVCPPLDPRRWSYELWKKLVIQVAELTGTLRIPATGVSTRSALAEAKWRFQARDQRLRRDDGRVATAVSSDGEVPTDQEILNQFVVAVSALLGRRGHDQSLVLRVLACCNADDQHLRRFLMSHVERPSIDVQPRAWLFATGECLREPGEIARFVERLLHRLQAQKPQGLGGPNDWLKAFAKILMYREKACEQIPTIRCENITEKLLEVFENELRKANAKYVFRHSALCIVYLLRRRIFDDGYLVPSSPLAERVKHAFETARSVAAGGKLKMIGGVVNLPETLKRLIDYIDGRGRGTIAEGLLSDEEGEAEED